MSKLREIRWVRLLLYGVYGLVVFLLALVATFPVDEMSGRLAALASARSGWQIAVDGGRWLPVRRFRFDMVQGVPPSGGIPVTLDDVRLDLRNSSVGKGEVTVDHAFSTFGGRVKGRVEATELNGGGAFVWDGEVRGLDLSTLPVPPPGVPVATWLNEAGVNGAASVTARTGWRGQEFIRGNGNATVTLEGLQLKLPHAPIGELDLPVGEVTGEFEWQSSRLEVRSLSINGEVINGSGSGHVMMGARPQITRLALQFTGTLGPQFPMREVVLGLVQAGEGKEMTIALRGTLARPSLYINGKTIANLMGGR